MLTALLVLLASVAAGIQPAAAPARPAASQRIVLVTGSTDGLVDCIS
jgi:hypothetical protein